MDGGVEGQRRDRGDGGAPEFGAVDKFLNVFSCRETVVRDLE